MAATRPSLNRRPHERHRRVSPAAVRMADWPTDRRAEGGFWSARMHERSRRKPRARIANSRIDMPGGADDLRRRFPRRRERKPDGGRDMDRNAITICDRDPQGRATLKGSVDARVIIFEKERFIVIYDVSKLIDDNRLIWIFYFYSYLIVREN